MGVIPEDSPQPFDEKLPIVFAFGMFQDPINGIDLVIWDLEDRNLEEEGGVGIQVTYLCHLRHSVIVALLKPFHLQLLLHRVRVSTSLKLIPPL